jgi:hypothetical protein
LTCLASPWCRATDISMLMMAAKPFTGWKSVLFDHDALAQKADIYSYLSWVALVSYCAEGSAAPDWRIAATYIKAGSQGSAAPPPGID